jgi:predicted phage tail protein
MNVALDNAAMLTSSGFTLYKPAEPVYIDNPGNVTISNGITSGELVVSVDTVKGAKSYLHQIATELPNGTTNWTSASTSRSKFTYSNLQPGRQYWVRVAVIGSRQQIAYSPVATQFAQ